MQQSRLDFAISNPGPLVRGQIATSTCTLARIVSGGQTGVDRGALDAALAQGFPCGGWCPPGRRAEDGPIHAAYPLTEMRAGGYPERTRRNVLDSDATAVIHFGELEGGTAYTVRQCRAAARPLALIDAAKLPMEEAAQRLLSFIAAHGVRTLNVAGPRESKAPGAGNYARQLLELVLQQCPPSSAR